MPVLKSAARQCCHFRTGEAAFLYSPPCLPELCGRWCCMASGHLPWLCGLGHSANRGPVLLHCRGVVGWGAWPVLILLQGGTDIKIIYEKDQTCPQVQVCRELRGDIIDTVSSNLILFKLQEAWYISSRGLTPPRWATATPTSSRVPFFLPLELCSTMLHLLFLHLLYTVLSYIFTPPFLLLHSPELGIFQQKKVLPLVKEVLRHHAKWLFGKTNVLFSLV